MVLYSQEGNIAIYMTVPSLWIVLTSKTRNNNLKVMLDIVRNLKTDYSHLTNEIVFNELRILFPDNITLQKKEGSNLEFIDPESPDAILQIKYTNSDSYSQQSTVQAFKDKNYHIIETEDLLYKGLKGFKIYYLDDQWQCHNAIFIPSKKIAINYTGPKEYYQKFKEVIDNIQFMNEKGQ